jgi:hypothetical protein
VGAVLDVVGMEGESKDTNNYPGRKAYNQVVGLFFCGHYNSFDWRFFPGLLG